MLEIKHFHHIYDDNWNMKYVSNHAISTFYFLYDEKARVTRRVPLVEQELLILSEHLSSSPVCSGLRVTQFLVLCVCLVDRCLSFCPFSFGHCVVCPFTGYKYFFRTFKLFVWHQCLEYN